MSIKIELSIGELLDKISILQIKAERIDDPSKVKNINKELDVLMSLWNDSPYSDTNLSSEINELLDIIVTSAITAFLVLSRPYSTKTNLLFIPKLAEILFKNIFLLFSFFSKKSKLASGPNLNSILSMYL